MVLKATFLLAYTKKMTFFPVETDSGDKPAKPYKYRPSTDRLLPEFRLLQYLKI